LGGGGKTKFDSGVGGSFGRELETRKCLILA